MILFVRKPTTLGYTLRGQQTRMVVVRGDKTTVILCGAVSCDEVKDADRRSQDHTFPIESKKKKRVLRRGENEFIFDPRFPTNIRFSIRMSESCRKYEGIFDAVYR